MLKKELKNNLGSFIIWTSILLVLFLIVFLVYPSIVNSGNMSLMDEMLNIFPEDILKAFNMDLASIDTAFGWLKTEGFVFVLLITGIYSGILGSNILLKEENDKTIEYLNSLPITRNKIIINKIICSFIYIFFMIFILGLFNFICLNLSGTFDKKLFFLLSITPLFSSIVIYSLCLFLSTFTHKTNKTLGVSIGIVFISYFLLILSEINEKVEWLKYISIFSLADIRNVIVNININSLTMVLSFVITLSFIILTFIKYNKKELI